MHQSFIQFPHTVSNHGASTTFHTFSHILPFSHFSHTYTFSTYKHCSHTSITFHIFLYHIIPFHTFSHTFTPFHTLFIDLYLLTYPYVTNLLLLLNSFLESQIFPFETQYIILFGKRNQYVLLHALLYSMSMSLF